jgi:hypothetical protein
MEHKASIADKVRQEAPITRLQQVPLLSKCSASYLQLMPKPARPRPLGTGDVLSRQGNPPVGVDVLLEGTLVARRDGEETCRIEPVASVGDISRLTGLPSSEEISSIEPGLALHIPYRSSRFFSRGRRICLIV